MGNKNDRDGCLYLFLTKLQYLNDSSYSLDLYCNKFIHLCFPLSPQVLWDGHSSSRWHSFLPSTLCPGTAWLPLLPQLDPGIEDNFFFHQHIFLLFIFFITTETAQGLERDEDEKMFSSFYYYHYSFLQWWRQLKDQRKYIENRYCHLLS